MSNWTSNTAPNYYTDIGDERVEERPFHPNDNGSLFQTDRGWEREIVYTDQHGNERIKRYVEIADREAQADVGYIQIMDVRVQNATDYSTARPTVNGGSAEDSFELEMTFNQAVAISGTVTLAVLGGTTPLLNPTYKSGNMTSQITWTLDTSSETAADELMLTSATSGAGTIVAWDRISNTAHVSTVATPVAANLAIYGASIQTISASDTVGLANTVVA